MVARAAALALLLSLPAACDSGDPLCTAADDPPVCDGETVVSCGDGAFLRTPCGADTYCNHGACTPTSIAFPRDAGFHAERSEWWYYTGHLEAAGSKRFGFEITIFQYDMRTGLGLDSMGYMCHVGVTDEGAGEHFHYDSLALEHMEWTNAPFVLELDQCRFEAGGDGNDHIVGIIPLNGEKDHKASPWRIDLDVSPTKRVARHGGDGIIPMAASGGTSWYYSFTRMAAAGTLSTPEGDLAVTGQAWMDHQWGGFDIVDFKGWDWWSLQFADNTEIMLFTFMDWHGKPAGQAGTLVDAAGNTTELEGDADFDITPLRSWDSPHTDGTYPLDWDITIPKQDWRIAVRTHVDDQEMYNPAQNYWEGSTTVTGTRGGVPVTGVGYTELTGYASDPLDPPPPEP